MKNFLISTFLLINVNLYSQDINIKYKKAAQFIRDSINLCEKYNIRCSDNHQKNEKYKPITTFKVSPEINFISIQPLMYKISTTDINVKLEAFDNTYKFEKYENRSLTNLSPDTGSFMILYFSKPIKNTLIAEILPCKTLISKNHYKLNRKRFLKKKSLDVDKEILSRESYIDNKPFNRGLRMLFIFDDKNNVISYFETLIIYN